MLDKLRHTIRQTAIYGIGKLGTKLIGLILLPLYTDYLTTSQYGILSLLEVTSQIMIGILGFRLSNAMMRWMAGEKDPEKKKTIVFTTYLSTIAIVLISWTLLIPFTDQFSLWYFESNEFSTYFLILFLSVGFEILNHITFDLIRMAEKAVFFIIIVSVKLAAILGLNIYFIIALELGVKGIILSMLIGNLLMLVISIPFILKRINLHYDRIIFGQMFRFGFPIIFSGLSVMILSFADRFILKQLKDLSEVGIYTTGYKIAGVINVLLLQSFQTGFLPIAYKMFDRKDASRFFAKVLTYLTYVLMIAVLVLSLFSKEFIMLFISNKSYWSAYTIVPLISLTFLIKGWQYVFVLGLHYSKNTKYIAYIVLLAVGVNIGLNYLLIPYWGIYGAAVTSIFSTLINVILIYRYSQKFYAIKYEFSKLIKIVIMGLAILAVYYFINDLNIYIRIPVKVILIISFPIGLYFMNFYDKIEIERFKDFRDTWRHPGKWKENVSRLRKSKLSD